MQRFETAVGTFRVQGEFASGRWALNYKLALERLLHAFALRPFEADVDEFEAARFAAAGPQILLFSKSGFKASRVEAGAGREDVRYASTLLETASILRVWRRLRLPEAAGCHPDPTGSRRTWWRETSANG